MKNITLRALEPEDIDLIYRWENDPQTWVQSAAHAPFSRHALTEYILDSLQSDLYASRQLRLMADDSDTGQTVGCIDLSAFDPHHQRAEIGMIIDQAQRGKGYGRPMVEALIRYCRESLQLHQLHCDIASDNTACLAIYDHCGFVRQGIKKHWIRTPQGWQDAVFFQLILSH